MINEVYVHHSEPNIGDSFYEPIDFSLNVYDGSKWSKTVYNNSLSDSLTELIRTDRKLKRIEKLNNIKKDYSNE